VAPVDWNLIACARHHLTYAPDEPALRGHLHVESPIGPAWRCLRCGDYVPGEPGNRGPADEAPVPLRGQQLRDAIVLRLLAVERLLKGLAVAFVAFGVVRFRAGQDAIRNAFEADLPLLQPLADRLGFNISDSSVVQTIRTALETRADTLALIAVGLAAYAVLQLAEGTGLWLMTRWGEYLSAVATSVFIPIEIYELVERRTWLRIAALVINVAAVAFIVYRKRLFGVRGGRAAYEVERHSDSLVQVARAAGEL
jgi:uncharacterized membrane protein (DUF2068 family)